MQAAVKYGQREPGFCCPRTGEYRWKYTFADVVFITDSSSRREITSWPVPGAGLDVPLKNITEKMQCDHREARRRIATSLSSWTSHTVVVVDQSGSMRKTDVDGGSTRSDAVWVCLALEFVAKQLESGDACSTDVFSLVCMQSEAEVLISKQPMDWILFNTLVNFLRELKPAAQGNYLPALAAAERLLMSNTQGSCALKLCFLSDGRPSDKVPPTTVPSLTPQTPLNKLSGLAGQSVEALASRFGRRLSMSLIGFAGPDEDFTVLKGMAHSAGQFGSPVSFLTPMLNAEQLGQAFTTASSTLTKTKTELTHAGTLSQRAVRDVLRETHQSASSNSHILNNTDWLMYGVEKVTHVKFDRGWSAPLPIPPAVKAVAMRQKIFGEGAERMVRAFQLVGLAGSPIGEKMVAKESRFIEDRRNEDLKHFHSTFCKTQLRVESFAKLFNDRLARVPGVTHRTPRITFLPCSVYMVNDLRLGRIGVLVEKMLDQSHYKKWNNNAGYVDGQQHEEQSGMMTNPLACDLNGLKVGKLPALEEVDEEDYEGESSDEDDDAAFVHTVDAARHAANDVPVEIHPGDIPQAFSHFTYLQSRRRLLICDLQGVFDADASPSPLFELTDPVIHYKSSRGRSCVFGRTDKGHRGINEFFRTHKCSSLCKSINKTWTNSTDWVQRR